MTSLYSKEAKEQLLKHRKNNMIVLLCLSCFFVLALLLVLILATYKTKLIFDIVGSVLLTLDALFLVYFIAKAVHIKNIYYDFSFIEEKEAKTFIGKVNEYKKELITLPDKSKVYVVNVVFKDETGKNFLISQIFDVDLEKDATYKFRVVSDYVKGYEKYER